MTFSTKAMFISLSIFFLISSHSFGYDLTYNPDDAVTYSQEWWDFYGGKGYNVWQNPHHDSNLYYNNNNCRGGDCANFVSQCLIAGGLEQTMENYIAGWSNYQKNNFAMRKFTPSKPHGALLDDPGTCDLRAGGGIWGTIASTEELKIFLINECHALYVIGQVPDCLDRGDVYLTITPGGIGHSRFIMAGGGSNSKYCCHFGDFNNKSVHTSYRYDRHFFHMVPTVPYVKEVEVSQGTRTIYKAYWKNLTSSVRMLEPDSQSQRNPGKVDMDEDLTIIITFNESIKTDPQVNVGSVSTSGSFNNTRTVWTCILPKSEMANCALCGDQTIAISANNYADTSNKLDANPKTIALWDKNNANFYNYENDSNHSTNDNSGGTDTIHHFLISPTFTVTCTPPALYIGNGQTGSHTIEVVNLSDELETFSISVSGSAPGWAVGPAYPIDLTITGGGGLGTSTFDVMNNNAASPINIKVEVTAETWGITKIPENLDSSANGHIIDQSPLFTVTCTPPSLCIGKGQTGSHDIQVVNLSDELETFSISVSGSAPGWAVGPAYPIDLTITGGGGLGTSTFDVMNNNAASPINIKVEVTAETWGITKILENLDSSANGHITDHPDDNYSISNPSYPTDWPYDSASSIGVLASGWGEGLHYLLGKYDIPTCVVKQDLSILNNSYADLTHLSVLLLGSAGLTGLDNSALFKENLAYFVSKGGVLIALTTQQGYEWEALPGGEISGYGWNEDMSCQQASVYIDTYHQILSGQDSATCDMEVDGYFTKWPDTAGILLRRTKNSMPALIIYPYGDGWVIAGTMYTDWLYGHGHPSTDELRLIRDIMTWSVEHRELPEYKPGTSFVLPITISNESDMPASKATFTFIDPDMNSSSTSTVSLPLNVGETLNYDLSGTDATNLGFWSVRYTLLDENDNEIQVEREGTRFVVSHHHESMADKEITFSVNSDAEYYAYGSHGVFTVQVWNNGDVARNITVWYSFPHNYWKTHDPIYGRGASSPGRISNLKETLEVPAKGVQSFTCSVPLYSYDRLWAEFYDENDHYLGRASRGFYTFSPSVNVTANTDKRKYNLGEDVFLNVELVNKLPQDYTSNLNIIILDPENSKVFEDSSEIYISAGEHSSMTKVFPLPRSAISGVYTIRVETFSNGSKIGSNSTYFEVPKPLLTVNPVVPGVIVPGTNTFTLNVENVGFVDIADAPLELKLFDLNGNVIWADTRNIDVTTDALATFNFDMPPLETRVFGDYRWTYSVGLGNETISGEKIISCSADVEMSFNKSSYHARENVGMDLQVTNTGSFHEDIELTVFSPTIAYDYSTHISLLPGQSQLIHLSASVPEGVQAGRHDVIVGIRLDGGSTLSETFTFFVPRAQAKLILDESSYTAGQTVFGHVANVGGVDSPFTYHLMVRDSHGIICLDTNSALPLMRAAETEPLSFDLPEQLASGQYLLRAVFTDLEGISHIERKRINVMGVEVNLEITAGKPVYATQEDIEAIATVADLTASLNDVTLDLSVFNKAKPKQRWQQYTNKDEIRAIAGDAEYIWFGTMGGVSRYDKASGTWQTYTTADGLADNSVSAIGIDVDAVWFVTYWGGVSRYDKASGTWQTYTTADGLANNDVRAIGIDADAVWFGTNDGGVSRYDKASGTWQTYTTADGLAGNYVSAIGIDVDAVWFGIYGGVSRYDKASGTWQTYTTADGLANNDVLAIGIDVDAVWLGTGGGVSRYDKASGAWQTYTTADGLVNNDVRAIGIDVDAVWFGTMGGVSRYDKASGTWQTYTTADGLADNSVSAIGIDVDAVWVGTYWDGVSRYDKVSGTWPTDGLANNYFHAIGIDVDAVWFGTMGGVSRYDKASGTWQTYTTADGLADNSVSAIGIDVDAVWVGTYWDGVSRYDKVSGTWQTYTTADGLVNNYISAIGIDIDAVWLGNDGGGVSRYDKASGTWQTYTTADGLASNMVYAIGIDVDAVWLGTDGGVSRYDKASGTWQSYTAADGLANNRVNAIGIDGDAVWFGTYASGVSRYDKASGTWQTYTTADGLADNDVSAIGIDVDAVWFGTYWCVSRYDKASGTWQTYTTADGLADNDVSAIGIDVDAVWFGTYWCVSRYDKVSGTWQTYPTERGLADNNVRAIGIDVDAVWLGTDGGVSRYDKVSGTWQTYTTGRGLADNDVRAIGIDVDAVWFGTNDGGVSRYDKVFGTWQTYTTKRGLASNNVRAIGIDGDAVWVGCGFGFGTYWGGVSRYEKASGTWQTYTTADGLASNNVRAIGIDVDAVWFGTDGGVSRYDKASGTWQTYPTADGLASNKVFAIGIDVDAVWFGTDGGVSRYEKASGTWQTYTTADGLASNDVFAIGIDVDAVWFGTDGGVSRYEKEAEILREKIVAVNLILSGDTIAEHIDRLDAPGKYYLCGKLISSLGQTLATDTTSFYVTNSQLNLTFSTDKSAYQPGEPLVVHGTVVNQGTEDSPELDLILKQNSTQIYTETFNLPAGESHAFTTTIAGATESFTLEGAVGDCVVSDYIIVEAPEVKVTVDAPETIGRDPFNVNVTLENTGHVDAAVQFEYGGVLYTANLKPGETKAIDIETSIAQDTTLEINLTGDVTRTVKHNITLDEKVSILVSAEDVYPEGRVNIPYTVSNTGPIDSEFDLTFTLDGQTMTKTLLVPAGETLSDSLVYDLEAGTYTLSYSSFFGEGFANFTVARSNQVDTDVTILATVDRKLPINIQVTNVGCNDIAGQLRISTDFYTNTRDLSLNVGETLNVGQREVVSQDYEWIEISESSADGYAQDDNSYVGPYDLPFVFTLEGIDYDKFEMCSNGVIELIPVGIPSGSGISSYGYKSDLVADYPDATLIMTCYDDLTSASYGYYGYQAFSAGETDANGAAVDKDCMVFCWSTPTYSDNAPDDMNTFEVVLYADGTIQWNFDAMNFANYDYDMYSGIYVGSTGLDLEVGEAIKTQSAYLSSPGISLEGVPPGMYALDVDVLHNGNIISHVREPFEVSAPSFELSSMPVDPVYPLGQEATMTFKVKNTGMAEGEAEVSLRVLDLLDETRLIWIAPGMEEEVDFTFFIPDDLPEKEHLAIFEINGEMTEIPFLISGVKIAVSASLDKMLYSMGDTAILTLDITNQSDLNPEMYARASANSDEDIQSFTLGEHQTVELSLPVGDSMPDRISYGIYLASGRAIYLNAIYIRLLKDTITLHTDKGVYQANETVTVFVETTESGDLAVSAPGYEDTIALSGSTTFSFTVPDDIVSSTYAIDYQFGEKTGVCYFDVEGYSAKVLEALLDRTVYEPVDTMDIQFRIDVNQDIFGILKGWVYSPDGEYTELFEVSQDFVAGENRLSVHADLMVSLHGIYRVVYALYEANSLLCLVTGAEAFDVNEAAITSVSTDKATYSEVEAIIATVQTFASASYSGTIDLKLNGAIQGTQDVTLLGEEEFSFGLGTLSAGKYVLVAQLRSDEVISEKQVVFYVADMAAPGKPTGLSLALEGRTAAVSWNANAEGDLAGYNVYRNGVKLHAVPLRGTTYRDEAIVAGSEYRYYVTAIDNTGNESESSYEVTTTLDNMPPIITLSPSANLTASVPVTVTYSVTDNLDPSPTVTANYLSPTTFNKDGVYAVAVQAEDASGNRASKSITIILEGVGSPPVISLLSPIGGEVLSGTQNITWEASDPDDDPLTTDIAYSADAGETWVTLALGEENDGVCSWDTTAVADGPNYLIRVTANDGALSDSDESDAVFAISNNMQPVAHAGHDMNTVTGKPVTLDGTDSFDPEEAMITFLWTFTEIPEQSNVTDASLSDVTSAKPNFTPDADGTYRLGLTVNDGDLDSILDEVKINAYTPPNVPPNANAGMDQFVLTNTTVYLDGTRSGDPDNMPEPLSYSWSFDSVPIGSIRTSNDITDRDKVYASFIPDVDGTYELSLAVSDGEFTIEDAIAITAMTSDVPPNANAGDDFTVFLGETSILDGSASNDPDDGPEELSYLWKFVSLPSGSGLTNEDISDADTVSPFFIPDVGGTYVVRLTVNDGQDYDYDHVAVTVESIDMDLPAGWSMISLSVVPIDKRLKAVFPNAVVVYRYEKGTGYVRVTPGEELVVGKGYWILLNEATSYTILGQPIGSYTLPPVYEDEWVMIGGCTHPAKVLPHGCKVGVIYRYVQGAGYQLVTGHLERGKGYWILLNNVDGGGTISVETVD